jgi:hypothetical protein
MVSEIWGNRPSPLESGVFSPSSSFNLDWSRVEYLRAYNSKLVKMPFGQTVFSYNVNISDDNLLASLNSVPRGDYSFCGEAD